jgi:hypothetical protein
VKVDQWCISRKSFDVKVLRIGIVTGEESSHTVDGDSTETSAPGERRPLDLTTPSAESDGEEEAWERGTCV